MSELKSNEFDGWVKTEIALPPEGEAVLVYDSLIGVLAFSSLLGHGDLAVHMDLRKKNYNYGCFFGVGWSEPSDTISHWHKLPQPPNI